MEDSGAILCQISSLKDMLDQVNDEIERNIQITRDIESEIVKCEEVEASLVVRELELMRNAYSLQLEIHGLKTVAADSASSVKLLEEDLCRLRMKKTEIRRRMNRNWEGFIALCLDFQKNITNAENDEPLALMEDRGFLENEIHNLTLQVEIQSKNFENEKLLRDIDELKATLCSAISVEA